MVRKTDILQHNPPARSDRGVAVVEAAVILIVFFTVLLSIMEAGRFLNVHQIVADATREGARYGVAPYSGTNSLPAVDDVPDVIAVINSFLASGNLPQADTTDTCGTVSAQVTTVEVCQADVVRNPIVPPPPGYYTHVEVRTTYQALVPIFNILEIPIVGDVWMRNETAAE